MPQLNAGSSVRNPRKTNPRMPVPNTDAPGHQFGRARPVQRYAPRPRCARTTLALAPAMRTQRAPDRERILSRRGNIFVFSVRLGIWLQSLASFSLRDTPLEIDPV